MDAEFDSKLNSLIEIFLPSHVYNKSSLLSKLNSLIYTNSYDYNYSLEDLTVIIEAISHKLFVKNDITRSEELVFLFSEFKKISNNNLTNNNFIVFLTLLMNLPNNYDDNYINRYKIHNTNSLIYSKKPNFVLTFEPDSSQTEDECDNEYNYIGVSENNNNTISHNLNISERVIQNIKKLDYFCKNNNINYNKYIYNKISEFNTFNMNNIEIFIVSLLCITESNSNFYNFFKKSRTDETIYNYNNGLFNYFVLYNEYRSTINNFISNNLNNDSILYQKFCLSLQNILTSFDQNIFQLYHNKTSFLNFIADIKNNLHILGLINQLISIISSNASNKLCDNCNLLSNLYYFYNHFNIINHTDCVMVLQIFMDVFFVYINLLSDYIVPENTAKIHCFLYNDNFEICDNSNIACKPVFLPDDFIINLMLIRKHLLLYQTFGIPFTSLNLLDIFFNRLNSIFINSPLITKKSELFSIDSLYHFYHSIDFLYLPFDVLVSSCLINPIRVKSRRLTKEIIRVFITDNRIHFHFKNIISLFFQDHLEEFINILFLRFESATNINSNLLTTLLTKIISRTNRNVSGSTEIDYSCTVSIDSKNNLQPVQMFSLFSTLCFHYNFPSKLSVLINQSLPFYNAISVTLMKLKWIKYLFNSLGMRKYQRYLLMKSSILFSYLSILRQLTLFTNTLENFYSRIIFFYSNNFLLRIDQCNSFDDLISSHNEFLDSIKEQLFYNNQDVLFSFVRQILELCICFYSFFHEKIVPLLINKINKQEYISITTELKEIKDRYNLLIRNFLSNLEHLRYDKTHPFVKELLLNLDFNNFYSK